METWPNFFIVGAPKAGTTSLYAYLKNVPGIYMSPIKEPNYFSVSTHFKLGKKPIRDKKKYLSLFKKVKDEKIIGEASPSYLSDPEAPKLIHQTVPNARILISLRDPVERAYSAYLMIFRRGFTKKSFSQEIENTLSNEILPAEKLLTRGLYFNPVQKYVDIFGKNQVKIIIFEELIKNPKTILEEILEFLGYNKPLETFENEVHNPYSIVRGPVGGYIFQHDTVRKFAQKIIPSSTRRILKEKVILKQQPKPKMNEEVKKKLVNFYHNDVEKLKTLLGRDLPWKHF